MDEPSHINPAALDLVLFGAELSQGHTGVAVYLRSLMRALQRTPETLRWAVAIPETRKEFARDLPPQNRVIVPGADARGFLWNEIVWQTRIARWVKRHAPQAVFHTPFHFWSPVVPKRLMMTAHDCIEMHVPEVRQTGRVRRLHRYLCWRLMRRAPQVVTVSNWTRQDLIDVVRVPAERIAVLYNWPSPGFAPRTPAEIASIRDAYRLPDRYVAYLGGFRSYKNVELLIEAWRIARGRGAPALVLGGALPPQGGGFYTDVREAVEKLGPIGKDIVLPGPIKDADLPLFYAGASLFVSPSRYEGFGYPPIEASACGTPVLVADRTAYREIFPERLRFNADDAAQLAERMVAALANPSAHVFHLDERFSEATGKREYEHLVRAMLGSK